MRVRGLLTLVLLVGCTKDNPAFIEGTGAEGSDSGSSGAPDGDGWDGGDDGWPTGGGSSSGGTGNDDGDDGVTTGGGDGTDGSGSDSGGVTSGGEPACPPFEEGFTMDVLVSIEGGPYNGCDGPLDVQGPAVAEEPGVVVVKVCEGGTGSCEPGCVGDEVIFEFAVPPEAEWMAPVVPPCAHVVVAFGPPDANNGTCPFGGVALWGKGDGQDDPVPWYLAGSGGTHQLEDVEGVAIEFLRKEPCACESPDPGCCEPLLPGKYAIEFGGFDGNPHVAEGELIEAAFNQQMFDLANYQSHVHPECGARPHIDWAAKRWPP
jgi:hypothetical protein